MAMQLPRARGEKARNLMGRLLLTPKERPHIQRHIAGWREVLLEEGASPRCFFLQLGAIVTHHMGENHQKIKCLKMSKIELNLLSKRVSPVKSRGSF